MVLGKAVVKAFGLSLISGAAFAAQVGFFHRLLGVAWQGADLGLVGLVGTAVYFTLRAPEGAAKGLSALVCASLGFFLWQKGSLRLPWAALIAAGVAAAYPFYLRPAPWLKPLSISGAWLLGLYAFTGKTDPLLYGMQGLLLALLTLPFDVSSMDTETLPTLPRVYGRAFAVKLMRVGLGVYAVVAGGAPFPLRTVGGATAALGLFMSYWPFFFSQTAVIGYDLLLIAQGIVGLIL
ncbi:MAG: hypothetical protein N3A68_02890 [Bacteroidia bacterium]|jgi:hypothetical protein|nr:hypothetical protein [Bacteroidia bacterium]GIV23117.1 MAG: hypothetical protein KatS3mg025_0776 [Bacteroidia bacterium]